MIDVPVLEPRPASFQSENWLPDPVYERRYLAKLDGEYRMGECFLTVSLGESYGGAVYKLIASIITAEHRQRP